MRSGSPSNTTRPAIMNWRRSWPKARPRRNSPAILETFGASCSRRVPTSRRRTNGASTSQPGTDRTRACARRTFWSASTSAYGATSNISSAWSRASKRRRKPCSLAAARAAIRRGCSASCCVTAVWRRALSAATSFNSSLTSRRWTDRAGPKKTSPTFTSVDDTAGPEWNTVAVGPMKRKLAGELMRRLKRRFTTGALLYCGEGKWYPGESLPRWALACYWRKDGQPIWVKEELLALESKNYGYQEKSAEEFIYTLARRLGCGGNWILPAFEDAWYYLWKERRLPTNVDPFNSRLRDEEERVRLAKVFEQGLD